MCAIGLYDAEHPCSGARRFWRVARNTLLGGAVKKLRRKVGTIRPCDRFKFGMYCDLSEEHHVLQWFEHLTLKLSAQIDGSRHTILETEPKLVSVQGRYLNHFWNHDLLQRFDLVQRLPCLSARPVFQQFRFMKRAPFLDESRCASG